MVLLLVDLQRHRPLDPFDPDTGWWVAAAVKDLVELWRDDAFAAEAWSALSRTG